MRKMGKSMSLTYGIRNTKKQCILFAAAAFLTAAGIGGSISYAASAPDTSSNAAAMQVNAPEGNVKGAVVSDMEENYLNGAEIRMIEPVGTAQNMSFVLKTVDGHVIVVDGGREEDADVLISEIQSLGGTVSLWLLTHPHDDHVGALTEILNRNPIPVQIDQIAYRFLTNDDYEQGDNMGRMENYTSIASALDRIEQSKKTIVGKGQTMAVGDAVVHVLNDPYVCQVSTFNNASIAYRIDMGGKRILFLGDMGREGGNHLLNTCAGAELKADIVQMAHHGNHGVGRNFYEAVRPEICMWPTPTWLWNNEKDGVAGAGRFETPIVRRWMKELGAKRNIISKDGTQSLK